VYLAFLGMVAATALVRGHPWSSLAAVLVFIAGTEIRVRAEERLLAATFQDSFAAYIARTRSSYLPGLR